MANTINTQTGLVGGIATIGDNSGALNIQTLATNAILIDTSQNVTIPKLSVTTNLNVTGSATFSGGVSGAGLNVQTFNSSGTWTKPTSGTYARIQAWGGGGGGGFRSQVSGSNAPGGGGGGYSEKTVLLSSLASTVTVTIGAGGVGRTGSEGTGGQGGNTTFGSVLTGYGGAGGNGSGGDGGGGGGIFSAAGGGASGTPYFLSLIHI